MSQTPSQHLIERVKALGLAFNEHTWFLGGSSALALRDIRQVGDIDIGVTTEYWNWLREDRGYDIWTPSDEDPTTRCDPPYLVTEVLGTPVHFFFGWRWRAADETRYNSFNEVFRDGFEMVKGMPVIKLNVLLRQKVDAVQWEVEPRAKDLNDIVEIVKHIKAEHFIL